MFAVFLSNGCIKHTPLLSDDRTLNAGIFDFTLHDNLIRFFFYVAPDLLLIVGCRFATDHQES